MEALTYEPQGLVRLDELAAIQADIPDYAAWRIPDLIDTFLRYHDLLLTMAELPEYRDGCADLLRHSGFIQKCILGTRGANTWASFTRAAYELHRDIEQLRAVLLDPQREMPAPLEIEVTLADPA